MTDGSGFELGNDGPTVIVVGLDASTSSFRAAAYAGGLARRQGARVLCVYVHEDPTTATVSASAAVAIAGVRPEIEADLRRTVDEASAYYGIDAELRFASGDPANEIARVADDVRADSVVVGASEKARHRLVGSVAHRLVRHARWPVTIVP
jgi:nucleotide-binding universal stress UspA family protein